ncbi:MAG TPA: pur operon repressor [Bacillota bacterium]|nr:pur operon repressor [Bacillota bacterium]
MNRAERVCQITQILFGNPNRDYSLGIFAERFGCAKSSVSEDMKLVRKAMDAAGFGYLETTSGSKGGVRFVPYISDEKARSVLETVRERFLEPDRLIGGGLFYTADIMFDPELAKGVAAIFARRFAASEADIVVTVETKGIGVALFVAEFLNVPLAVIRREARVTEGSTLSINYFSGSSDRIQKMSLSKRAVKKGSRAIIIDDFMRGGGSIAGMKEMLSEFDSVAVGVGVVVAAAERGASLRPDDVYALLLLDDSNPEIKIEMNI